MTDAEEHDGPFYDIVEAGFGEEMAQDAMYERLKARGVRNAKRGGGHE